MAAVAVAVAAGTRMMIVSSSDKIGSCGGISNSNRSNSSNISNGSSDVNSSTNANLRTFFSKRLRTSP